MWNPNFFIILICGALLCQKYGTITNLEAIKNIKISETMAKVSIKTRNVTCYSMYIF